MPGTPEPPGTYGPHDFENDGERLDAILKAALSGNTTRIDELLNPILVDPVSGYAILRTLAELAVPDTARGGPQHTAPQIGPDVKPSASVLTAQLLAVIANNQKTTADDLAAVGAMMGPDFSRKVIHNLLEVVADHLRDGALGSTS